MNWLEIAKNLPQGQHTRCDCPECGAGTNTNAAIVNHNAKYYSIFCNACDHKDYESKGVMSLEERRRIKELNDEAMATTIGPVTLPPDTSYCHADFSRDARMWLFKGGLTPSTWTKYGIGYSKKLERVVLPVYDTQGNLIWYQCRAILKGQKPKYLQPARDKNNIYYMSQRTTPCKRVVVVEDILSFIRGDNANVNDTHFFTPLGTKLSSGQAQALAAFELVTTWLDPDKAGITGARKIRKVMSLLCDVSNIKTELDPKCYSNKQIQDIINGTN